MFPCHFEPLAVIPSGARNLALVARRKLREESPQFVRASEFKNNCSGLGLAHTLFCMDAPCVADMESKAGATQGGSG